MSDTILIALVALGGTVLGALLALLGTFMTSRWTIESTMAKENFAIKKADYQERLKAVAALKQSADLYRPLDLPAGQNQHEMLKATRQMVSDIRACTKAVRDCLASSPWAYAPELRLFEHTSIPLLLRLDAAAEAIDVGVAQTDVQARVRLAEDLIAASTPLVQELERIYGQAEDLLLVLSNEYSSLVQQGI